VRYRPAPAAATETDGTEFAQIFKQVLKKGRGRDLGLGHTADGPHRDDLVVELSEIDLRRFGSAGQLRASLICLKLGKLSLLGEHGGESPLFLMDDFDSDLDERRAGALTEYLERGGFQTLVATAKEDLAARLGAQLNRIRMEDGVARVA
jgi:DNA replication and repair protein RecF